MDLSFEQPFEQPQARGGYTRGRTAPISFNGPVNDAFILQVGELGNPSFYVDGVDVTPSVPPNGIVDVSVSLANERRGLTPFNPDECFDGDLVGLEAEVTVDPSWTSAETVSPCVGIARLTPRVETFTFDFPAPSTPGTYHVDVTAETTNKGGTVRYEVAVPDPDDPDQPPRRPGDGDEDDENGDGEPGLDIPGLDIPLVTDLQAVTGGVALVLLLYLLIAV